MRRLAPWQAYLFATVVTLATIGARFALDLSFRGFPGLLIFLPPIVASAYVGGLRGGLLATLISSAAAQFPLDFGTFAVLLKQVILALAGVCISMLGEGLHRARSRARAAASSRDASQVELQRHAALLMNAQRLAGLGIWELDVATGVLTWSEETCRIFGVAPGAFAGTRDAFYAFVHPDDVASLRERSDEAFSGSGLFDAEYRIVRSDGEVRVVAQRGQTTVDAEGHARRRFGVVMDITERIAALENQRVMAEQLAREKGRLLVAQAVAKVGSWETIVVSGEVEWSDETHRIFETSAGEFSPTHEKFLELVHPQDRGRVRSAFESSLRADGPCALQHRIVTPGGRVKVVEERWQATRDEGGIATRVLGTCQDVTEREQAVQALATMTQLTGQREKILSTMLASIRDFAYIFDLKGRFLFANQPLLDLWGLGLDEVVGKGFFELGYPDALAQRLGDEIVRVIQTRESLTGETEYVNHQGASGIYEYIFSPVIGANRAVEFVVGSTRDITGRKQSQLALLEAEQRYRSLFENSAEGIFQNTPEGRVLAANPALARMLGYASPEELVGSHVDLANQSYADPTLRAEFRHRLEREGAIEGFEYQVRRKDGTLIWVSENVRVVRGADGAALRYEGSAQDVTERRRAQEALRRQTAELRVLFDLVPAMIWFKDTQDRIVRINQRAASAAGRSIEEIEGHPSAEIYPLLARTYREDDNAVIASGEARLGLVERLVDANGRESWVQTDKVPFFGEDGKVAGIIVMAQDITERKRAEAELRKTHNQLLEVSRLGGMAEVATEVLHNVGNILNSVNVSAALVVENVRNSRASRMADVVALLREHRGDLADYITSDPAGQHIPELLEDLSREWGAQQQLLVTELGELHSNVDLIKQVVASQQSRAAAADVVEQISLDELVEDAVRVQQGVLSDQQVRLVREFTDLPPVHVARSKAVGILVSLLRNGRQACKHLEPQDRCITLRIARAGRRAAISVSDNGAGIAAENLVRIFAPGYTTRLDARSNGLHSAALAATELGGSLEARSDGPGKGSTFTLELPLGMAAAA